MTAKQKNFIVRAITGVLFVAIMVTGMLDPTAMIALFTIITCAAMWEYTGLINTHVPGVQVNQFISTAAAAFLFLAMAIDYHNYADASSLIGA